MLLEEQCPVPQLTYIIAVSSRDELCGKTFQVRSSQGIRLSVTEVRSKGAEEVNKREDTRA